MVATLDTPHSDHLNLSRHGGRLFEQILQLSFQRRLLRIHSIDLQNCENTNLTQLLHLPYQKFATFLH